MEKPIYVDPKIVAHRAQTVDVGGNKWQDITTAFNLPTNLQGLNMLDIGAGQSDLTAWLLRNGANAFAIDPLYANLSELEQRRRKLLIETIKFSNPHWASEIDKKLGTPELEEAITLGLKDTSTESFRNSIKENPSSYIAASSHALPFEDGYFDIITSYYGLFGVATIDSNFLDLSLKESLRTLKKGGKLYLAPAAIGPGLSELEIVNEELALSKLMQDTRYKFEGKISQPQGIETGVVAITVK